MINRQLTGNWRLRSRERVWGRPWVVVEVEERVKGKPIEWLPYYVDKVVWRPIRHDEMEPYELNRIWRSINYHDESRNYNTPRPTPRPTPRRQAPMP